MAPYFVLKFNLLDTKNKKYYNKKVIICEYAGIGRQARLRGVCQ